MTKLGTHLTSPIFWVKLILHSYFVLIAKKVTIYHKINKSVFKYLIISNIYKIVNTNKNLMEKWFAYNAMKIFNLQEMGYVKVYVVLNANSVILMKIRIKIW